MATRGAGDEGVADAAAPAIALAYAVLGQGIGWGRSPRFAGASIAVGAVTAEILVRCLRPRCGDPSFATASRKWKAAAALLRDRRRNPAGCFTSPVRAPG
jgi:hypothetical protein